MKLWCLPLLPRKAIRARVRGPLSRHHGPTHSMAIARHQFLPRWYAVILSLNQPGVFLSASLEAQGLLTRFTLDPNLLLLLCRGNRCRIDLGLGKFDVCFARGKFSFVLLTLLGICSSVCHSSGFLCCRIDDSVIQQKTSDDVFARLTSSLAQESDPDM